MHSSFRSVSGSLSAWSSSFYLLPLFLFTALPFAALAELLAFCFTRHAQTQAQTRSTLALVRLSPPAKRAAPLAPFRHSRPRLFPRFLHHRSGAALFGAAAQTAGESQDHPALGSRPWFFITLVTGVVTLPGTSSSRTWCMKARR